MLRKPYPNAAADEEWALDAPHRKHDLREIYNALKWLIRSGSPWRMLPHDFPRWETVYQHLPANPALA